MKRPHRLAGLLALLIACLLPLRGESQRPPERTPRYTRGESHDDGGSGKFYMKREIAQVMSHEGAGWLERPEREKQEEPKKVLKILDLKPGQVVADIGAGSGYYSFRMAEKLGPRGKVLAVDVQKEMLDIIRRRMKRDKIENVEPILGSETDPKLPAGGVDLILMVDVYHEFASPYEMTQALIRALKPNGRLVFVEFRREDEKVPIRLAHKMTEKQVLAEMAVHPLKHVKTERSLPWQHVVIFEKKAERAEPRP